MALNEKKNVSKFDEDFIKNHDEDSNKGYILEVNNEYPKHLLNLHSDSPFLAERMKIKKLCYSHKSSKTSIESRTNAKQYIE